MRTPPGESAEASPGTVLRFKEMDEVSWPFVDGSEGAVRQINFVIVRAEEWVLQVNEFVKGTEEHHVAIQNQHEL